MDVGTQLSPVIGGDGLRQARSWLNWRSLTVLSLGAAALAAASIGLVAMVWQAAGDADQIGKEPIVAMAAAAAVATLPVVILFALRGADGERVSNPALALGLLVLGLGYFGLAELGPLLSDAMPGAGPLGTWILAAAVVLIAGGLPARRIRLPIVLTMLLVAVAALVAAGAGWRAEPVIGLVGFGCLLLAYAFAYHRLRTPHYLWLVAGLIGYLFGGIAANGSTELWILVAGSERLLGSLILLGGLGAELSRSSRRGREQLAEAQVRMRELRDVAQATQLRVEERDHDARSALSAIENTAHALRHHASLGPATVDELERALSAEVALLRRLIALPSPTVLSPFRIAEVLHGVVVAERLSGLSIDLRIPADLEAFGDPESTAQVVQNLLENCRRHAPGSPVVIIGADHGPWALVKVEDSGPGIPSDQWAQVLRRGHDAGHPSSAGGSGLGLFLAERLMREQRGFLWAQSSPTGGASVRLALPAYYRAPDEDGAADAARQPAEGGQNIPAWGKR